MTYEELTASSSFPQDPFYYDVPDSLGQTIKFHSYGPTLLQGNTAGCLLAATIEVLDNLQVLGGGEQEIGNHELKYNVGNVFLILYPGVDAPMTWSMWGFTLAGLYWFMRTYGSLDLSFEITELGHLQAVGMGMLGRL